MTAKPSMVSICAPIACESLRSRFGRRYPRNSDPAQGRKTGSGELRCQQRVAIAHRVDDALTVRQSDRRTVLSIEFQSLAGNDHAAADLGGALEGSGNPRIYDEFIPLLREPMRDRNRGFDDADAGYQNVDAVTRLPEGEFFFDGAGEQNHGAPMNLCVWSERRKRCGCAFA